MAGPEWQFDTLGPLDFELQDIGPSLPSRQPTLEAQHHVPRAKKAWEGFLDNIRTGVSTSLSSEPRVYEFDLWAASKLQPKKKQFQDDYLHLSHRSRAPVASFFHLIVKKMVQPPDGLDTIECDARDEIRLSDWLETIHEALVVQSSDSLILCSLTAENPKSNSGLLYKILSCFPSQVQSRREVPRRALIYLLSRRPDWHLPREVVQELAEADTPPEIEQYQGLPSERFAESCIRVLSKDCMSMTLRWVCTVPKYKGKLDNFIRQPFRKPPPFFYVKIFISNRDDPRNLRILLLFRNKDSRDVTWSPALDGAFAIIVAYKHALRETSRFLRQASKQIMALTFESREGPSKQQIQYLIHLQDCFKRVAPDMQQNHAQLREVVDKMQAFVTEGTPFVGDEIFSDLEADSNYILAELTKLERETNDLVHEIEFQQRFDQNSNTLTFLALLYVPLSFATSFMGMLLTDPSAPSASQISSTSSNSASSPSLNVAYNTNVPAPSPGPRLWDLKMFGYLAVPLLIGTVMMPLISGTLLRFVVKTYTHLTPWYPLAWAVLWVLCLIYYNASQHFVAGISNICFDAAVVAVVIYQTYRAFRKKERRTLSSLFLVGIALCFILDWFVRMPIPLAGTAAGTIFVVAGLLKYVPGGFIGKLLRKIRRTQTAEP